MLAKTRIVHNVPKRLPPNLSLPDPRVAIDPGTKIRFGIVQVKRHDLLHSNQRIDLANG